MDYKIVYALIIGSVLFACGIAIRMVTNQEGPPFILSFITPFVIGVVATGVKRGFTLSFVLSFIYSIAYAAIFQPDVFGAMSDINVAMAFLVFDLFFAAIGGALGAVGGLLGKRIFKEKGSQSPKRQ